MTMWVWRLSPEVDYYTNAAQMQFDEQFFRQSTHPTLQRIANCDFSATNPGDVRTWLINEIFNQQKLRQGWGGIDLDLNLPEAIWIRNWQLIDPNMAPLANVQLRYRLLIRMLNISIGDTIFLPRVGDNQLSSHHFTVVTAAGSYDFENRSNEDMYWKQDFTHVIPLEGNLTRTFLYSPQTLTAGVFGAPFIAAVVRVPDSAFRGFDGFLLNHNYPFRRY